MSDALGLLGLLGLLFGAGGGSAAPARGGSSSPPLLPAGGAPPWPQVIPSDLPPFPGTGWEYDEPPPQAVQQRAAQLVSQLWQKGAGSFKTEQTAGRWITYRAEKVRSGKNGVVAYRLKGSSTTSAPPALPRTAPPARPPSVPAPTAPTVLVTSPGLPQKQPAAITVPLDLPAPGVPTPHVDVEVGPAVLSPVQLPDLHQGDGMPPKKPDPNVALVQQKLGIPVDGKFGEQTRDAVIAFQVKTGLAPNQPLAQLKQRGFGAVKQATWVALFAVRS